MEGDIPGVLFVSINKSILEVIKVMNLSSDSKRVFKRHGAGGELWPNLESVERDLKWLWHYESKSESTSECMMDWEEKGVLSTCRVEKTPGINNRKFLKERINNFGRVWLPTRLIWGSIQRTEPTIEIATKDQIVGRRVRNFSKKSAKKFGSSQLGA